MELHRATTGDAEKRSSRRSEDKEEAEEVRRKDKNMDAAVDLFIPGDKVRVFKHQSAGTENDTETTFYGDDVEASSTSEGEYFEFVGKVIAGEARTRLLVKTRHGIIADIDAMMAQGWMFELEQPSNRRVPQHDGVFVNDDEWDEDPTIATIFRRKNGEWETRRRVDVPLLSVIHSLGTKPQELVRKSDVLQEVYGKLYETAVYMRAQGNIERKTAHRMLEVVKGMIRNDVEGRVGSDYDSPAGVERIERDVDAIIDGATREADRNVLAANGVKDTKDEKRA